MGKQSGSFVGFAFGSRDTSANRKNLSCNHKACEISRSFFCNSIGLCKNANLAFSEQTLLAYQTG